MASIKFRGWLELNNFVATASGSWRRLGGLFPRMKTRSRVILFLCKVQADQLECNTRPNVLVFNNALTNGLKSDMDIQFN